MAEHSNVRLQRVDANQAPVLRDLMQLYLSELAPFAGLHPDERGQYTYPYLQHYWHDPDRTPFFILHDDTITGFTLLRRERNPANGSQTTEIAEFFILEAFRRQGIGGRGVQQLLNSIAAKWQIRVLPDNHRAARFWLATLENLSWTCQTCVSESGILFELDNSSQDSIRTAAACGI